MRHLIDPVYFQDFILAGNCEFTLRSMDTGNEEIFIVKRARYENMYWVNNRLRQLIGRVLPIEGGNDLWWFSPDKNAPTDKFTKKQIEIFVYFWNTIQHRMVEPERFKIEVINHHNRCGHCHRPLTHPESIPIGIGPDCFVKLGLQHKQLKLSQHKISV